MNAWSDVWVNQFGRPIITDTIDYDSNYLISDFKIVQKAEDKSDKVWSQQFEIGLIYPPGLERLKNMLLISLLPKKYSIGREVNCCH